MDSARPHHNLSASESESSEQSATYDVGGPGSGAPSNANLERRISGTSAEPGNTTAADERTIWTPELHVRFLEAISSLGLADAVPKAILERMGNAGLSRESVASHLQKHRLVLKTAAGLPSNALPTPDNLAKMSTAQSIILQSLRDKAGASCSDRASAGHLSAAATSTLSTPAPMSRRYPPFAFNIPGVMPPKPDATGRAMGIPIHPHASQPRRFSTGATLPPMPSASPSSPDPTSAPQHPRMRCVRVMVPTTVMRNGVQQQALMPMLCTLPSHGSLPAMPPSNARFLVPPQPPSVTNSLHGRPRIFSMPCGLSTSPNNGLSSQRASECNVPLFLGSEPLPADTKEALQGRRISSNVLKVAVPTKKRETRRIRGGRQRSSLPSSPVGSDFSSDAPSPNALDVLATVALQGL